MEDIDVQPQHVGISFLFLFAGFPELRHRRENTGLASSNLRVSFTRWVHVLQYNREEHGQLDPAMTFKRIHQYQHQHQFNSWIWQEEEKRREEKRRERLS
jgi:hypothetical protein